MNTEALFAQTYAEARGKFLAADSENFSLPADRMCNH